MDDSHWQFAITADLERLYAEHMTAPTPNPLHIAEDRDGIPAELSAKWNRTIVRWFG